MFLLPPRVLILRTLINRLKTQTRKKSFTKGWKKASFFKTNKQRRDSYDGIYNTDLPDDAGNVWYNGANFTDFITHYGVDNNEYLIFRIMLGSSTSSYSKIYRTITEK